jgi:hypothetical protein
MKKAFSILINSVLGVILTTSTVLAAFAVDLTAPSLTTTFYSTPANDSQHVINADYNKSGAPPYDMIVPSLAGGSALKIKVLLPPGTKYANIRGESNDWIGASGQQPVVGVISQDVTSNCPVTTDNILYSCMGVTLQPPAGGLSMPLYSGSILTAPKYVNFVLHNPSGNFSFSSLSIAIQISDVAAYKTWRNARPWAGGVSTNSIDGLTGTDSTGTNAGTNAGTNTGTNTGTTAPTGCPTGSALMPTISTDLTLTIPRLKFLPGGLGDMKVILKPVRDPNDPSQIVFELMSLDSPDFFFLPC